MIPVSSPELSGNERAYVLDCLESGWISSAGNYVEAFEEQFAQYCGVRHGVACTNGTVALHLALLAAGVGPGDEVIVPTLTYVATANAVRYCGATPIFVDSEPDTWNINPSLIEQRISARTRAIIPVHLYGHPCDLDPINAIARRHRLAVIEDAAEAHGAAYRGRRVGGLGTLATFSFYGNKLMTCGEGGMVLTNDGELAATARQLRGQGVDPDRRYWHPVIGFNYRMTNITAAIGLAQLERLDEFITRRRAIAFAYQNRLEPMGVQFQPERGGARHVYWMPTGLIAGHAQQRDALIEELAAADIETRPMFPPMHTLPPHQDAERYGPRDFPVAEDLAARGITLPSFHALTTAQIDQVCDEFARVITGRRLNGTAVGPNSNVPRAA